MAKLDDVLSNSLNEIRTELKSRVTVVYEEAKTAYQKNQPDLTSKSNRIEEIDKQISALTNEKDVLNSDINNSDPTVTTREHSEAKKMY